MDENRQDSFGRDIELVGSAVVAGRKIGARKDFWQRLASDPDFFQKVLLAHQGEYEIKEIEPIVDFDIPASVPYNLVPGDVGLRILDEDQISGRKKGKHSLSLSSVKFFVPADSRKWISALAVKNELFDQPVLGAQALDFLMRHQQFIPIEWRKDSFELLLFWGTIYRTLHDNLMVRYLQRQRGRWTEGRLLIDDQTSISRNSHLAAVAVPVNNP